MQMLNKFVAIATLLLFTAISVSAQTPAELLKKASKAVDAANGKKDKMAEAEAALDAAMKAPENQSNIDVWLLQAKFYNDQAELDNINRTNALTILKKASYKNEFTYSANKGLVSIQQAIKLLQPSAPDYKKQVKKVVEAASKLQPYLNFYSQEFTENKDYANSYTSFKGTMDLHDFIKANGGKSSLDDSKAMDRQMYLTALISTFADKRVENIPLYEKLIATGKDTSFNYSALYDAKMSLKTAADSAAAISILTKGRAKFPDDSQLLFTEINYYLKIGKLDVLIDKLKEGIKREPKNVGLYFTLGNVYDNLSQQVTDETKKTEYDNESINYYNKALEIDPKNTEALYSLGARYYNKAAKISKDMKAMESDFSKAGQKKYDGLEKEMQAQFDLALPYFKKAESFNANDQNTLIALKEIFARKNDLKTSNEFKARLQTVTDGGKNATPFFKE